MIMMNLLLELRKDLANGLQRKASTVCSRWAENYVRVGKPVPGPLRFERFPWSREMHDYNGDWVGKKAAQMAYTQAALDRAIFTIDIKRVDVLYVLPKKNPDASDFSKGKFDAMLELSPHLEKLFSNARNIGHKQSGNVNFYLRGARSRSGLKTISVGLRVYDEFDEMPMRNIALADERSSGYEQTDKQNIKISTPTIPGYGIDEEYKRTTQEHFFFPCPKCDKWTELVYPECLVIPTDDIGDEHKLRESYYVCRECKGKLESDKKIFWLRNGKWNSTANADSFTRGFEINQLYSTTILPWEIAKAVLAARQDENAEQELHNSKLGQAHEVSGARITEEMIQACMSGHARVDPPPRVGLLTMGVDVGKVLHYQISQWLLPPVLGPDLNMSAVKKVVDAGTLPEFEDLDRLMMEYQIGHTVVDANPETRKAYEFCLRYQGRASMCYFSRGINSKQISVSKEVATIHVHRASWLDLSQGRFRRGLRAILLPRDISPEYKRQIKALVRKPGKDSDGNPIVKYISTGSDHFGFANVYDELALPLAVSNSENQDVSAFL